MKDCTLYIVDDDDRVRQSLRRLLEGLQAPIETFESGESFLERVEWGRAGCLILDVVMPGMSGLEVLQKIPDDDPLEVIVLTGYGSVSDAVTALKLGAFDYIEKPPQPESLVTRIEDALQSSLVAYGIAAAAAAIQERVDSLTPSEREVLDHLAKGWSTAEIAKMLHRAERTIGNHRQRILEKMHARSTPELIRMLWIIQ